MKTGRLNKKDDCKKKRKFFSKTCHRLLTNMEKVRRFSSKRVSLSRLSDHGAKPSEKSSNEVTTSKKQ